MAGFEDAVAQASGIYPEMDFSQLGLGKIVVDGQLVDEEKYSRVLNLFVISCLSEPFEQSLNSFVYIVRIYDLK